MKHVVNSTPRAVPSHAATRRSRRGLASARDSAVAMTRGASGHRIRHPYRLIGALRGTERREPAALTGQRLAVEWRKPRGRRDLGDGVDADLGPVEPRPDDLAALQPGPVLAHARAWRGELHQHVAVGAGQVPAPGEESRRVAANADVAIREQHGGPAALGGHAL